MKKETQHIRVQLITFLVVLLYACDSSDPAVCFDDNEPIAERMLERPEFTSIRVGENIALVLVQGPQSIRVSAPESFVDDVHVDVENGVLLLSDDNRCDLFRESAPTTIFISAPDINRIRNGSQYEVRSDGVLGYEKLVLISDLDEDAQYSIGEFRLELDVVSFEVISNNISNFYISGSASEALIGFYSGSGRFEGAGFLVDDLRVFHRGSNKMIVHPINSIRGQLVSNGDVIAKQEPPIVEVMELAEGRLLFE